MPTYGGSGLFFAGATKHAQNTHQVKLRANPGSVYQKKEPNHAQGGLRSKGDSETRCGEQSYGEMQPSYVDTRRAASYVDMRCSGKIGKGALNSTTTLARAELFKAELRKAELCSAKL